MYVLTVGRVCQLWGTQLSELPHILGLMKTMFYSVVIGRVYGWGEIPPSS